MSASILILTKNEEKDLPGCLNSIVSLSDDIHILDSMSSDQTVAIGKRYGAQIVQREFDDWASHQNWALKNINFKYPWVFYLDADERVSYQLAQSILDATKTSSSIAAFRVQRRDFFLNGTWLKYSQISPLFIRLFRPKKISYARLVNPITHVDGTIGQLDGYLDHYPFSKGMRYWLERHLRYADLEAKIILAEPAQKLSFITALFSSDFNEKRVHQKRLFYKLPLRPLVKFFYMLLIRRSFLDGRAGLTYSLLQAIYEYFIVLRTHELRQLKIQITPSDPVNAGISPMQKLGDYGAAS